MSEPITLKGSIRGGHLCFDALKKLIESRGYILEGEKFEGACLTSSQIDAIPRQYREVHDFFFPDEHLDYEVSATASDENDRGSFRYAVFDSKRYSDSEMRNIISKYNEKHR